ncbi:MAG: 4a-hydroxytetrahydrobiopterin dehydratase [Halobacteria archaeon]
MTEYKENEIEDELSKYEGWSYDGDRIRKNYEFDTYMDGIEFVNDLAEMAEAANHHPDLHVGFREVEVTLKSHDVDAITDRDFDLVKEIEE